MPPSVSTGDWDAVVRQIRWCAAVQTPVNCHCQLEDHPVGDVEPVKFFMQYLTQVAVKLPSTGDDTGTFISVSPPVGEGSRVVCAGRVSFPFERERRSHIEEDRNRKVRRKGTEKGVSLLVCIGLPTV